MASKSRSNNSRGNSDVTNSNNHTGDNITKSYSSITAGDIRTDSNSNTSNTNSTDNTNNTRQGYGPAFPTGEINDLGLTFEDIDSGEWIGKLYKDPRQLTYTEKLFCFHSLDAKGNPTGVVDVRVYNYLTHTQHIFVCGGIPYVYTTGYYEMDQRGTIIKSMIRACLLESFIKSSRVEQIFKLFLQARELEKQPGDLNNHREFIINFRNGMLDARTLKLRPHDPKYLSTIQVPREYEPGKDYGPGTKIGNFLRSAIPDKDDQEMLLEYIGLCCTIDTRQQKMMIICGEGGTGKSTIIKLVEEIVGEQNISNVPMSKLSENFQAITLMGKLLNSCADLEIDALDDSSMVKKLVGEDSIRDSFKGKDVIFFRNRAKMLFSTNELPIVKNEKTEGLFRRLLILCMNTKPEHKDPDLMVHLEDDMPFLLDKAMKALNRMYKRGYIFESPNSADKIQELRNDSDSIEAFLFEKCVRGSVNDRIERAEIYEEYTKYCKDNDRTPYLRNNFYRALRNKGYGDARTSQKRYFTMIRWADTDADGFMDASKIDDTDIPFNE